MCESIQSTTINCLISQISEIEILTVILTVILSVTITVIVIAIVIGNRTSGGN